MSARAEGADSRAPRRRSLRCEECGARSAGSAWFWIARVEKAETDDEARVVVSCPSCAERRFRFFSNGRRTPGSVLFPDEHCDPA